MTAFIMLEGRTKRKNEKDNNYTKHTSTELIDALKMS